MSLSLLLFVPRLAPSIVSDEYLNANTPGGKHQASRLAVMTLLPRLGLSLTIGTGVVEPPEHTAILAPADPPGQLVAAFLALAIGICPAAKKTWLPGDGQLRHVT